MREKPANSTELRDGPDERHAEGSYYTPRWLVDSVVRRALEPVLGAIDFSPASFRFRTLRAALRIRVIDPAAGDGAFLLGATDFLAAWFVSRLGANNEPRIRAAVIRRCLYGVDLNASAIESARERLALHGQDGRCSTAQLARHLRCADSLLAMPFPAGTFAAVIGNPPYVDSETMTRDRPNARSAYAARWSTARGNWDLFVPFVELSLHLVRDGGQVALVVPNKLQSAKYAAPLRRMLRTQRLRGLIDMADSGAFPADVYPIVLHVERGSGLREDTISVGGDGAQEVPATDFKAIPDGAWYVLASPRRSEILHVWRNAIPLGEVATIGGAATVSEAYAMREQLREACNDEAASQDDACVVNTGTIERYRHAWNERSLRYLGNTYRRPVIALDALREHWPRRFAQTCARKLVLGGLCRELKACWDRNGGLLAAKSTLIVRGETVDLRLLAALLNSRWMTAIYRAMFGGLALQGGYLQITTAHVKALPFPPPRKIAAQETMIQEIVERVEAIAVTTSAADFERLDREIEERVERLFT